jgi:hypothetical protein
VGVSGGLKLKVLSSNRSYLLFSCCSRAGARCGHLALHQPSHSQAGEAVSQLSCLVTFVPKLLELGNEGKSPLTPTLSRRGGKHCGWGDAPWLHRVSGLTKPHLGQHGKAPSPWGEGWGEGARSMLQHGNAGRWKKIQCRAPRSCVGLGFESFTILLLFPLRSVETHHGPCRLYRVRWRALILG